MNNSAFGKTVEIVRKHRDIKLVRYSDFEIFRRLISNRNEKGESKINKPVYLRLLILEIGKTLTLFRMGEAKSPPPPTSLSFVSSTNVGFGPKNFLTFNFNPFVTLVQNFKFVPSASPKLLNLNQDHASKKAIFLVKSL